MQFSNFIRTESGNQIIFSNTSPLIGIKDLKFYKDNSKGSFNKKEFRWSFNKDYWSSWEVLNQGNISNINIAGNKNLFLEIRYISAGSGEVSSFLINYDGLVQVSTVNRTCPFL